MIAYEILVQTIADWKAGVRPTAPTPPVPARTIGQPEAVEEVSSGVVDFAEDGGEVEIEDEAAEEEQGWDEQQGWDRQDEGQY